MRSFLAPVVNSKSSEDDHDDENQVYNIWHGATDWVFWLFFSSHRCLCKFSVTLNVLLKLIFKKKLEKAATRIFVKGDHY